MEMDGDAQHPSFRRYVGADSWSPYPYQKAAVPLETLLSLQITTLKRGGSLGIAAAEGRHYILDPLIQLDWV